MDLLGEDDGDDELPADEEVEVGQGGNTTDEKAPQQPDTNGECQRKEEVKNEDKDDKTDKQSKWVKEADAENAKKKELEKKMPLFVKPAVVILRNLPLRAIDDKESTRKDLKAHVSKLPRDVERRIKYTSVYRGQAAKPKELESKDGSESEGELKEQASRMAFLEFQDSPEGFLAAEVLTKLLDSQELGRSHYAALSAENETEEVFGYMASREDMWELDPRRSYCQWRAVTMTELLSSGPSSRDKDRDRPKDKPKASQNNSNFQESNSGFGNKAGVKRGRQEVEELRDRLKLKMENAKPNGVFSAPNGPSHKRGKFEEDRDATIRRQMIETPPDKPWMRGGAGSQGTGATPPMNPLPPPRSSRFDQSGHFNQLPPTRGGPDVGSVVSRSESSVRGRQEFASRGPAGYSTNRASQGYQGHHESYGQGQVQETQQKSETEKMELKAKLAQYRERLDSQRGGRAREGGGGGGRGNETGRGGRGGAARDVEGDRRRGASPPVARRESGPPGMLRRGDLGGAPLSRREAPPQHHNPNARSDSYRSNEAAYASGNRGMSGSGAMGGASGGGAQLPQGVDMAQLKALGLTAIPTDGGYLISLPPGTDQAGIERAAMQLQLMGVQSSLVPGAAGGGPGGGAGAGSGRADGPPGGGRSRGEWDRSIEGQGRAGGNRELEGERGRGGRGGERERRREGDWDPRGGGRDAKTQGLSAGGRPGGGWPGAAMKGAPSAGAPGSSAGMLGGHSFEGGYIFQCNSHSVRETMERCLFGAPSNDWDKMKKMNWESTAVFLYDSSERVMHGVFTPLEVGFNLVPAAFNGRMPSQVRVTVFSAAPQLESHEFMKFLTNTTRERISGNDFSSMQVSRSELGTLLEIMQGKALRASW